MTTYKEYQEYLKELGTDEETIKKIINGMKKDKIFIAENEKIDERFNKLKTQYETLENDKKTADETIEALKKDNAGNQDLQEKIKNYETEIEASKKKMAEMQFNYILDNAIKDSKVKNLKAIKALLDVEKITLSEDGKLIGLSEQIEEIKKTDPYMFEGVLKGKEPNEGGSTEPDTEVTTLRDAVANYYSK